VSIKRMSVILLHSFSIQIVSRIQRQTELIVVANLCELRNEG